MSINPQYQYEDVDPKDIDASLDEAQMVADDRKDQDLPEAPASVTLRVWIKGYGVMITARDTKVASLLQKTETLIDYAVSHGWKNVWDTNVPSTPQTPSTSQTTSPQASLGVCSKCGAPNALSKNNKVYCSKKCWL